MRKEKHMLENSLYLKAESARILENIKTIKTREISVSRVTQDDPPWIAIFLGKVEELKRSTAR